MTILKFFLPSPVGRLRFSFWSYVRPLSCEPSKCPYSTSSETVTAMKILNVAEKNDAAKNIAFHLSGGNSRKREGFSKFNKIYEFDYSVRGQNATMVMTSVSGHLLALDFGGQFKNWRGCNPLALFDAPIVKFCPPDYQNIKRTLEREVRSCQMLIIWTDCDREGENIGFEIIETCQAVKPNIQVFRARFSEITAQSVRRAINTLEPPNKLLSDAVAVRSELDLRIGAAFTRFQTLRLQQVFPQNLGQQLISYGSCQFPTLGFVVERYKAIERFIPEEFWKIAVSHTIDDVTVDFSWKRVRLFDELACRVLFDTVQEQSEATVEKVLKKPKSKWRPLPLDTIELEKLGSKKLKINAKETMRIAERLYTQGFISYPRTETNIFPKEMNLRSLIEMQTRDNRWGGFAQSVLQEGINPRQGKKSDQAHPPIHPTKYTDALQGNEGRVYEFIVRHFLACCSKDAQGHETVVDIEINGEKFVASGLRILERNYLDVYPYENWKAKEIHAYEEGQRFQPTKMEMDQSSTTAPNPLTEADLIALMEKHGIGTDATHAEHIETIKNRSYVGLDGTYFLPGELGLGLVDGYDSMGFPMSKPNLRSELEADLQRIADGTRNAQEVLAEQLQNYRLVFERAIEQAAKIDIALEKYLNEQRHPATQDAGALLPVNHKKICSCPQCGQDMVLRTKANGSEFYVSCMGFPDCRASVWFPSIVEHVEVSDEACGDCERRPQKLQLRFKRGAGRPFYPDNYKGCVGGCDTNLMEVLGARSIRDLGNRGGEIPRGGNSGSQTTQDSGFGSLGSPNGRGERRNGDSVSRHGAAINPSSNVARRDNISRDVGSGTRPVQRDQRKLPGSDAFVCSCNVDAIQLTVRKEGPNQGRPFYKCGNNPSCDFFMWADEASAPPTTGGNHANTVQSTLNFSNVNNGSEGEIVCLCGNAPKSLTVAKEGPNKGRQFYACAQPRDSQCNFFQWADNAGENSNSTRGGWNAGETRGREVGTAQNQDFNNSNRLEGEVVCSCGEAPKNLTVAKEGPNKGRPFYVCAKPRDSQCNFFQWADNAGDDSNFARAGWNSGETRGRGGGRGRGQGGNVSNWSNSRGNVAGGWGGNQSGRGRGAGGSRGSGAGSTSSRGKRKCGHCGQEG